MDHRSKEEEILRLRAQIAEWNANRLDLFEITPPNEELEFHGVMRFFFQENGEKVVTKCIRVTSTSTTRDLLNILVEKFHPDMKMLTLPKYALYEVHVNGEERRLRDTERPLYVQLYWGKDDREGRFLLKEEDDKNVKKLQAGLGTPQNSTSKVPEQKGNFVRKLSKREKKEAKKQEKLAKARGKENETPNTAERLYTELPETSFTRSISNPEAVMRRRRQMKLEKKLQEIRSKDGGPDTGGTLKIYGETLRPDLPYKTLLLSTNDYAAFVVKETLDKYALEKEDPSKYCLVQVISAPVDPELAKHERWKDFPKEFVLEDFECPLAILMQHPPSEGSIMFQLRRRTANMKRMKKKKGVPENSSLYTADSLPYLMPLNPDESPAYNQPAHFLPPDLTEIGREKSLAPNSHHIQLLSKDILPRHAAVSSGKGVMTITPTQRDAEVWIDNQRVYTTTRLNPGNVIRFGRGTLFKLCTPATVQTNNQLNACETTFEVDGHIEPVTHRGQAPEKRYRNVGQSQDALVDTRNASARSKDPRMQDRQQDQRMQDRQQDQRMQDRQQDPRMQDRQPDPRMQDRQPDPRMQDRQQDPRTQDRQQDPRVQDRQQDPRTQDRQQDPRTQDRQQDPRTQDRQHDHQARDLRWQEPRMQERQLDPRIHESHVHSAADRVSDSKVQDRLSDSHSSEIHRKSMLQSGSAHSGPTAGQPLEDILPATLEYRDDAEEVFLSSVISEVNGHSVQFKLAPTYTLYMAVRYCISSLYRPEMGPQDRAFKISTLTNMIAAIVQHTVKDNKKNAGSLSFWMANASELLHFFKQDMDVGRFSMEAQDVLADTVQESFRLLVLCMQNEIASTMMIFLEDSDKELPEQGEVLQVLSSAMSLLRRCRVNAALTIQLFSQLFHFINMWLFNKLVLEPKRQLCMRKWGVRFKRRLAAVETWAEKQGLELAADCHLARIIQAAHLLHAPKSTHDDITAISSTCFKLNSLQLRALLQNYIPEAGEPPVQPNFIAQVVTVAESTADELTRSDGRQVRFEEEAELNLPFLLPEDGYSCDIVRGVPSGLSDFVAPLLQGGLCRMTVQPMASGSWIIYMVPSDPESVGGFGTNVRNGSAMDLQNLPTEPEVVHVTFGKVNGSMGLSIVAAKGDGQEQQGIYIKSVVPGGAAAQDGRLHAGDQLLQVDGQSLVGLTQERAAEIMTRTAHTVTLKVAKQGAIYHGLGPLLSQPSPVLPDRALPRERFDASRSRSTPQLNSAATGQRLLPNEVPARSLVSAEAFHPQPSFQRHLSTPSLRYSNESPDLPPPPLPPPPDAQHEMLVAPHSSIERVKPEDLPPPPPVGLDSQRVPGALRSSIQAGYSKSNVPSYAVVNKPASARLSTNSVTSSVTSSVIQSSVAIVPRPHSSSSPSPWAREERDAEMERRTKELQSREVVELQAKSFLSSEEQERLRRLRLDQEFKRRLEEVEKAAGDDSDDEGETAESRSRLIHMARDNAERVSMTIEDDRARRAMENVRSEQESAMRAGRRISQFDQERREQKERHNQYSVARERETEEYLRKQQELREKQRQEVEEQRRIQRIEEEKRLEKEREEMKKRQEEERLKINQINRDAEERARLSASYSSQRNSTTLRPEQQQLSQQYHQQEHFAKPGPSYEREGVRGASYLPERNGVGGYQQPIHEERQHHPPTYQAPSAQHQPAAQNEGLGFGEKPPAMSGPPLASHSGAEPDRDLSYPANSSLRERAAYARPVIYQDGLSGQQDRTGGQQDRTGGQQDRTGGQQDRTGGQQDRTGGQQDRTGGQQDRSGGQQDRTGGQQDRTGGQQDRSGGQQSRSGGQSMDYSPAYQSRPSGLHERPGNLAGGYPERLPPQPHHQVKPLFQDKLLGGQDVSSSLKSYAQSDIMGYQPSISSPPAAGRCHDERPNPALPDGEAGAKTQLFSKMAESGMKLQEQHDRRMTPIPVQHLSTAQHKQELSSPSSKKIPPPTAKKPQLYKIQPTPRSAEHQDVGKNASYLPSHDEGRSEEPFKSMSMSSIHPQGPALDNGLSSGPKKSVSFHSNLATEIWKEEQHAIKEKYGVGEPDDPPDEAPPPVPYSSYPGQSPPSFYSAAKPPPGGQYGSAQPPSYAVSSSSVAADNRDSSSYNATHPSISYGSSNYSVYNSPADGQFNASHKYYSQDTRFSGTGADHQPFKRGVTSPYAAAEQVPTPRTPEKQMQPTFVVGSTPNVVGAQEVYRDPRERIQNARFASQQQPMSAAAERMSFRDKMNMFAGQAGENTPPDKAKHSYAQREIETTLQTP